MQTAEYPEVPDDFGHWLAGFIDGEGSFYIQRYAHRQGYGYQMRFALKLRDDDQAILRHCVETSGIGYLNFYHREQPNRPGSRPQVEWLVVTKGDCLRLVGLLDRYPLRSKKARDYAIWREAVLIHTRLHVSSSARGKGRNPHAWGAIPDLWRRLPAVRAYEQPSDFSELGPDSAPQLWTE